MGNTENCTYTITDAETMKVLASVYTPQLPYSYGPSYYFSSYFGGEETTSEPVTISYAKQSSCS